VTRADRTLQSLVDSHHLEGTPEVTHFIAATPK
jgi:hypothetical protein